MYIFEEQESPDEAFRRVMLEKISESLGWMDRFAEDPVLAVHETRKNIKRSRALLRLVRPGIGEAVFRRENYAFRDIGRLFSDLRDCEVILATFRLLHSPVEGENMQDVLVVFEKRLEDERDRAYAQALKFPERQNAARKGLLEIRERRSAEQRNLSFEHIRDGFSRSWKRAGRQFLSAAGKPRTPMKFHEWRKAVKYLLYQHELLSAWAESDPAFMERGARLDHLSNLLGLAHDAAVLSEEMVRDPVLTTMPDMHRRADYFRIDQEGAALIHGEQIFLGASDRFRAS